MDKVRIGVIGTGMAWERLHYPAIQKHSDKFEILKLYDLDASKVTDFINKNGLDCSVAAQSMEDVFGCVDAVIVAVPIEQNYNVAKAVINAGKALFAEKPFAATVEGAEELIELSKQKGVDIFVAENYRFNEESSIMRNIITNGDIGNIAFFINVNVCNFEEDMKNDTFASRDWRQHPEFYGGTFLDSCIHDLARLRYLFGNVTSVYATGTKQQSDFNLYSVVNAVLSFENGVKGHYTYFCQGNETILPKTGLRVFGSNGEFVLHDKLVGELNLGRVNEQCDVISFTPEKGFELEFLNFYNMLKRIDKNCCPPELEIDDIKLVMAILKSIEEGNAINIC